jgi:uncharacterized protein YrrD
MMEFKEGANVFTAEEDKVGEIVRVVIDPMSAKVTHIVVQKGFLFTTDKVVPIDLIADATGGRVILHQGVKDLEALPDFQERHYVPARRDKAYPPGYVPPLHWYPPVGSRWWGYSASVPYPYTMGYPAPPFVIQTERNIPEGTVPLKEGAKVIGHDGEHVGDVERVFTDSQSERVTHFVISEGLLLKERTLVPATWVIRVVEDEVRLAVDADFLDALPEYEPA